MSRLLPVCELPRLHAWRGRPWVELVLLAGLAAVAVGLAPAGPPPWLAGSTWAAAVLAALAGAVLAVAVDRCAGRPAAARPPGRVTAGLLLLAAGGEEAAWRGGLLAALASRLGPAPALALSALAFGAVHGPGAARRLLHGGTGLAFGTAYLAGGLAAAAACHCAYTAALLAGERRAAGRTETGRAGR